MKVQDVMIKKTVFLEEDHTLLKAAKILVKNNISGAPVVDSDNNLVGIISEKDLFKALYPDSKDILENIKAWFEKEKTGYNLEEKKKVLIKDLMVTEVITIEEDEPILKVGAIMLSSNIQRVPVVRGKRLVGLVSRRDIFRQLLKKKFDL